MLLHVRHLIKLTALRLHAGGTGIARMTENASVAALAAGIPPDLRVLELRGSPV